MGERGRGPNRWENIALRFLWWILSAAVVVVFWFKAGQVVALVSSVALVLMAYGLLMALKLYPEEVRQRLRQGFEWDFGPLGRMVFAPLIEQAHQAARQWQQDEVNSRLETTPDQAREWAQEQERLVAEARPAEITEAQALEDTHE